MPEPEIPDPEELPEGGLPPVEDPGPWRPSFPALPDFTAPTDPGLKARSTRPATKGWIRFWFTTLVKELDSTRRWGYTATAKRDAWRKLRPFWRRSPDAPEAADYVDVFVELLALSAQQNGTSFAVLKMIFERIARCTAEWRDLVRYMAPRRPGAPGEPQTPMHILNLWLEFQSVLAREFGW